MERSGPAASIPASPSSPAAAGESESPQGAGERGQAATLAARLESLYQFAYGLSHEINNPLANIAARAQTLLIEEADPQRRRVLATIVQQAFRAYEMLADLMLVARPPQPRPDRVNVSEIAVQVGQQFQPRAAEQGTRLEFRCAGPWPVLWLDGSQLGVLLTALIQNALEAVGSGGVVQVGLEYLPGPGRLHVVVADDGPGIPAAHLPYVFDPFFSGREAGRGLGLGLCKVWRIAQMQGGTVRVESSVGQGTRVSVELPASEPP